MNFGAMRLTEDLHHFFQSSNSFPNFSFFESLHLGESGFMRIPGGILVTEKLMNFHQKCLFAYLKHFTFFEP